jgi:hypothetical protein
MAHIPFQQRITCTIPEAEDVSGFGNTKIKEFIADGRLKSVKVDKRRLIYVASLLKLLGASQQDEQAA